MRDKGSLAVDSEHSHFLKARRAARTGARERARCPIQNSRRDWSQLEEISWFVAPFFKAFGVFFRFCASRSRFFLFRRRALLMGTPWEHKNWAQRCELQVFDLCIPGDS